MTAGPTDAAAGVSIVVVAGDDPTRTAACLRSVAEAADVAVGPVEVVLVASRSSRREPPAGVRTVDPRAARTPGARRNVGADAAGHGVLVFLDDCVDVRPGWLAPLAAAVTSGGAAAAGAQVVGADGRLHHAGGWLLDDHRTDDVRPVARWFGEPVTRPGAGAAGPVRVAAGLALAVERAAFVAVGGFDEGYRQGFEDADLCLRLVAAGRTVRYEPASLVVVPAGVTLPRPWSVGGDDARRFARAWHGRADVDLVVRRDRSVLPGLPGADATRAPAADVRVAAGPTVRWAGSLFGHHSLAQVNRELAVRLERDHGVRCDPVWPEIPEVTVADDPRLAAVVRVARLGPVERADVTVQHGWPPNWVPPADGSPWVVVQPWEFGCLPAAWATPLRDLVDEYWVPTDWVRRCAVASGVPAHKVRVVPNGVDRDRLRPDGPRYPLATTARTRLLFVGGAIKRKGIDVLVESYLRAFTPDDDVCLVLKLTGGHSFYKGSLDEKLRTLAARRDVPAIEIVEDGLSNDDVAALYRACTALVHPYRGEGFGMPIAEAMACGLPVVVTGEGAARDFCHPHNAYLVPAVNVPLAPDSLDVGPPAGEYWLAEPDRDELVRLLRHVQAHPDEAAARGEIGRRTVLEQLDWDRIAATAAGYLRDLVGRTPRRFDPLGAFHPSTAPLALDGPRRETVLLEVDGGADWEAPLAAWTAAVSATDDVTLVLVAATEEHLAPVEAAAAGFDGDVLVVLSGGDEATVAAAYAACDRVLLAGPATAARAERMGRPTLAAGALGRDPATAAASFLSGR